MIRPISILCSVLPLLLVSALAQAANMEHVKKITDTQVKEVVQPLLDKYCPDQCKILSVEADVEYQIPDEVAPGFDELSPSSYELGATSVKVKLLMDELIGPVSRNTLLSLMKEYLQTLRYPVFIDVKTTRFPQPPASAKKINALKQKAEADFRQTLKELFMHFCPDQCLLADFAIEIEPVNTEETQYGSTGEFLQDGDTAIRIQKITGTLLLDNTLLPEEKANILEMARLKTSSFKNVELKAVTLAFPSSSFAMSENMGFGGIKGARGVAGSSLLSKNKSESSSDSKTSNQESESKTKQESQTNSNSNNSNESAVKNERFERYEKVERVENGDALREELKKFGLIALVFGCAVLALLITVAVRKNGASDSIQKTIQTLQAAGARKHTAPETTGAEKSLSEDRATLVAVRYQNEQLAEELSKIFAEQPKVAKQVFSRVLTEEGVEVTSQYIKIFGESIVLDLLKDPSLQADLTELMEYYAKTPIDMTDGEKLELLKALHNRTVAAKMVVMGNRASALFDFLVEMDALQVMELVRNESLTVKAIVLTQCDNQKRNSIFMRFDTDSRMKLLTELSRIDHLPRDYIHNVANALRRKRRENPRLNTEALPGSEVLVTLLEKTGLDTQRSVIKTLESFNNDNARGVKSKLVSIDTLLFLRDAQLLETVLSLKHDELLTFLKGAPEHVREAIFSKSPQDLVAELLDELKNLSNLSRETYNAVERKLLNRLRVLAESGTINLLEINERMFNRELDPSIGYVEESLGIQTTSGDQNFRKAAGW